MIGRGYTVTYGPVTETTAQSLIRLSAPSTAALAIVKAWIGQESVDDLNEVLSVQIHRASTDGTGTSVTPNPMSDGDSAFGGTAIRSITADPTESTILVRDMFNAAGGWVWTPFDETGAIIVPPSGRIVLHLETAPSVSMNFNSGMEFYEIGT